MFSGTLVERLVAGQPPEVLIAGDDEEVEEPVARLVRDGGLRAIDVEPCQAAGGTRATWDHAPAAAGFELPERLEAPKLACPRTSRANTKEDRHEPA